MNDTSGLVDGLLSVAGIFNFYAIFLLFAGGVALWALAKTLNNVSNRLMEKIPARRFFILQISTLLSFALYIFGTVGLLIGVLQPPKELIFAAAGSVAVALGFALKDIAASLVAGILLLFDRPFRVGDRVSFGDTYGEIVSIGLRTVRLVTLDDNLVTIPNSRFITDVVSSGNAGELDMMVVTDFHLALDADIPWARKLLEEVVVTSRYAYLKKPVSFVVEELEVAHMLAIRLRVKAYVLDVRYEKAFQSDIVLRGTHLLNEHKIARPKISSERT
ncbi:MAG: mechanosensitive ion channel domain-containing protein [Pseudomonadota bacterium]|nr:mechanosensitive ion channel domain-containing protein [Pseudomonadota bacterium]MED5441661.1 mechanosensitive ion channel domain-containing protein [Pseudomonadota bacterium]